MTYKAPDAAELVRISNLDLSLQAPSLSGEVDLTSSFTFREMPVAVAGSLTNPLALMGGEQVPVDLKISSGENSVSVTGQSGLDPMRAELASICSRAFAESACSAGRAGSCRRSGCFCRVGQGCRHRGHAVAG